MKIFLPQAAKESHQQNTALILDSRLPVHVSGPCKLDCTLDIMAAERDYFLVGLQTQGLITIICQRCLQTFPFAYQNEIELAVCKNDAAAERLLPRFECIVSENYAIDLQEIVTDDLHLYTPEKHDEWVDCDETIIKKGYISIT